MKVAVPSFQHSEMLGQPASSQTVTRSRPRSVERTSWNVGPVLSGTRIHSGLRDRSGTGSWLSPSSRAASSRPSRRSDTPSAAAPAAGLPSGAVPASAAPLVGVPGELGQVRRSHPVGDIGPVDAAVRAPCRSSPPRHEVHDLLHRHVDALGRQRCHSQTGDPAGHDPSEPLQVGIDVEREAVHGAGPRQPHADGGDLAGPEALRGRPTPRCGGRGVPPPAPDRPGRRSAVAPRRPRRRRCRPSRRRGGRAR